MSKHVEKILTILNTDDSVRMGGFLVGFMSSFKFEKNTLENPLSTFFISAILGGFCSWGAGIVGGMMPSKFKFMIPIVAIVSSFYYKYLDMFGPPPKILPEDKNRNTIYINSHIFGPIKILWE